MANWMLFFVSGDVKDNLKSIAKKYNLPTQDAENGIKIDVSGESGYTALPELTSGTYSYEYVSESKVNQKKKYESNLRARVMGMIKKVEDTTDMNIVTDIDNVDLATTGGAGTLQVTDPDNQVVNPDPDTDNGALNPSVPDVPTNSDAENAALEIPAPDPEGNLVVSNSDNNAQTTSGDGISAVVATNESTASYDSWTGSIVVVKEKKGTGKKVDSGTVTKADAKTVTVNGQTYERSQYQIVKIA